MTTALALLCRFEKTQSVQSSLTPSSHTKKLPSDTEHDFQITSESKHRKIQIGWLPHWSSKINKVPHGIQPNMQNKFYNPNQEGWISFAKPTFLSPVTLESLEATSSPAKKKTGKTYVVCRLFFFPTELFHPMESISRLENAVTRSWTTVSYATGKVPKGSCLHFVRFLFCDCHILEVCHLEVVVQFSTVYVSVFVMYTTYCMEIRLPQDFTCLEFSSEGFKARFKIFSHLWLQIETNDMQIALIFLFDLFKYFHICSLLFLWFCCMPRATLKKKRPRPSHRLPKWLSKSRILSLEKDSDETIVVALKSRVCRILHLSPGRSKIFDTVFQQPSSVLRFLVTLMKIHD